MASAQAICWGDNSKGQLGTGDTNTQTQPTIITVETVPTCIGFWDFFGFCWGIRYNATSPVEQISAGGDHSCAIVDRLHNAFPFSDAVTVSVLYCWGSNTNGELGTGNTTEYHSSQKVSLNGDNRITAVSAGPQNTCAIANFQLYCWGNNTYGQLGGVGSSPNTCNGIPSSCSNTPRLINGFTGMQVTAVSVGATHICAIANGNGYCWGDNTYGQLGMGATVPASNPAPQLITTGVASTTDGNVTAAFTSIAAGDGYTCAIINGTAACWGKNDVGQTGTGSVASPVLTPTTIAGAAGSMQGDALAAGDSHTCAVLQARVYCWGNNANGRVGNGLTTGVTSTPYLVNSGGMSANVPLGASSNASINIAAGGSQTSGGTSCSVTNADIVCWGAGTSGQIGIAGTSDVGTPATIPLYRSVGSATIGPIY
jgi:alpha-tubulin suppressor-like RCC1 family protein